MERADLKKWVLATGYAEEHRDAVFLCDPGWGASERSRVPALQHSVTCPHDMATGWLCLPTGGSSGGIRFARHDEQTLGAALDGFCTHFGVRQVNALHVLPAYHVSGLMAAIRSAATGGQHVAWSWKQLEAGMWPILPETSDGWFLSLVPTQLQRLLAQPGAVNRLRHFRAVFIGGGPLWPEVADPAAAAGIPVVIAYGMTETGAMVCAQHPGDFNAGDRTCGTPMPHARIEIIDETSDVGLPHGATGLVRISGPSIFRGYWPDTMQQTLTTDDLGQFDIQGRLSIAGRRDAVIITGGKKVHPLEIEEALRKSGQFTDIAVIGVPDPRWGSRVVACYPQDGAPIDQSRIESALAALANYKHPKEFLGISPWPRNAQGKINRVSLTAAASAIIESRR